MNDKAPEFCEIVYSPELAECLLEYFTGKSTDCVSVEKEIRKMSESGTMKPIIFNYLFTVFQILRITKNNFDITNSVTLDKIRICVGLIYEDADCVETITRQLFKYYIQTSLYMQKNPQIREEISHIFQNLG
jgi:hypothetical protein